jgi:lysophospholipase L1-like esterase
MNLLLSLLIALGDSITYGWNLPHPPADNYAAQYAHRIGSRIVNLAVPGYACSDVLTNELPKMPRGASVVILNCGTNDVGGFGLTRAGLPDGHLRAAPASHAALHTAMATYARIIHAVHTKEPDARIILVTIRDWQHMTGPEDPRFTADVAAWNAMLRASGLKVVDVARDPRMYEPAYIHGDLIHPNLAGNTAIANDF